MNSKALATLASCFVLLAHVGTAQSPYEIKARVDTPKAPSPKGPQPQPRPWQEMNKAIPIASSFSGGISLGSYQSGVNWGITQFLKLARTYPQYRADKRLPEMFYATMTGASAGNINALLSAIEYCDTELRPPEWSLYWKMWVSVGWPQLFPGGDRSGDPERGLLDRSHIRSKVIPAVDSALTQRKFLPGCRIPIGIVVTRLTPGKIPLDTTISLPAQRYVAMFEARVLRDSMHLTTPQDVLLGDRSLGAQLSLYHATRGMLKPQTVFDLVEASAAYPIAFPAKSITYREPECQLNPPPHCDKTVTEDFIDGGVFDNNPVGLAYKMFEGLDVLDTTKFEWTPTDSAHLRIPRLMYVDPYAYRGTLAELAIESKSALGRKESGGFTSVIRLVTGFIPSARTYELQSFARALVTSKEPPVITATTRAHPVIGQHLGAFAAFLGRPFREFDFAVGVSDAIHYTALEILCDPARLKPRQFRRDAADSAVERRECFRAEYHDLLRRQLLIPLETQRLVGAIANRTDPDLRLPTREATYNPSLAKFMSDQPRVPITAEDRRNLQLLESARRLEVAFALEEATANLMLKARPRCETTDLFTELLCIDRFEEVMRDFRKPPQIVGILNRWADECAENKEGSSENCRADHHMVALVENPALMLRGTFLEVLRRLRDIEEQKKKVGEQHFKFTVKTVEMAYRSTDGVVRRGPEISPSSIADENSWWWTMNLLPYYAGGGVGVPSFQLGWQPTWHVWRRVAVILPIELTRFQDGMPQRKYHWYTAISPGAALKFRNVIVNQVQGGARIATTGISKGQVTWEAGALIFAGKLRMTAFRIPGKLAGDRSFPYAGTVSLADANGLLYWLIR